MTGVECRVSSRPPATSDRGRPAAERGYAQVVRRRSLLRRSQMPPVRVSSIPAPMTASHRIGEPGPCGARSEEHTSELQSHSELVCRHLPEKQKERKGG